MERDSLFHDVLIVGGGPAGLAAAIRLKQHSPELAVCLIDKGSEIGAHLLSGAILDPRALDALLPDWRGSFTASTPVTEERFLLLGRQDHWKCPELFLPQALRNQGLEILSLGELCRWLATQAEALGVEIYPGFAGQSLCFDEAGSVIGVQTGDLGRQKDGREGPNFQPGPILSARFTLLAAGARGHLGKILEQGFGLRKDADPQTYSLGIKELWEIPAAQHRPGLILHTIGWPLPNDTQGGGFLYHYGSNRVALGLVTALDYPNPWLSPPQEFQRFKTHPALAGMLAGGQRLAYGARAVVTGGLQALPHLGFPGGLLIGDNAGFMNAARIKGIHAAIESGRLAADAVMQSLEQGKDAGEAFEQAFHSSWLAEELARTRNFKPLMKYGLRAGSFLFGLDQHLLRGKAPWTLHNRNQSLNPAAESPRIAYPKPDGVLSFDLPSSLELSGTRHEPDQPCHLVLAEPEKALSLNHARYASPEERYCPAGVYEIERDEQGEPSLRINAENCLHCKACDIRDPGGNIRWQPPQGGEGPFYAEM